jgi:hypothetical protein
MSKSPVDPCPICYFDQKEITPLQYTPGRFEHYCEKGHTFPDRDVLVTQLQKVNAAIRADAPKPVAPEPPAETPAADPTFDETAPIAHGDKSIVIGPVDFVRLTQLLGHFTDSSSLVGSVFAINQQLLDAKELYERLSARAQVSKTRKLGGEETFEAIIPERHVEPIRAVAEANNMSVDRYMNAWLEEACDNNWCY